MTGIDERVARLAAAERDRSHADVPIRDAASLILVDRAPDGGGGPAFLMGRRSMGHVFMPGAFVFPGGRVDPQDLDAVPLTAHKAGCEARLGKRLRADGLTCRHAFAVAAVRETREETGVLVGTVARNTPVESGAMAANDDATLHNVGLDLAALTFIARAITPPGRPRRYDTRFFVADRRAIAGARPLATDGELEAVRWVDVTAARDLGLPAITQTVIDELCDRLAIDPDLTGDHPVPFWHFGPDGVVRELL